MTADLQPITITVSTYKVRMAEEHTEKLEEEEVQLRHMLTSGKNKNMHDGGAPGRQREGVQRSVPKVLPYTVAQGQGVERGYRAQVEGSALPEG